jgi:hypothetical protein
MSWQITCSLFIIISQDLAPWATRGVGSIFEPLAPIVHQQLLCHLRMAGSRLRPSQHCSEEWRVPPGIHPILLQQEECHPRGCRQVDRDVLQEGT